MKGGNCITECSKLISKHLHLSSFSLLCGLPSTQRWHFCPEVFEDAHPWWINLKMSFLCCSVDCENRAIWKRCCIFSHVTHILLLDIFSCTDMVVPTICILQSLHTIFILHSKKYERMCQHCVLVHIWNGDFECDLNAPASGGIFCY